VSRHERRPSAHLASDLVAEATWLGRALFMVAVATVGYWVLFLSGGVPSGGDSWRAGDPLAHLFLTACTAIAAVRLFRDAARSAVNVALAAGALVVVTLESLARPVMSGLSQVDLWIRVQILADAAGLAVGIWAFSYALRLQRRAQPA